MVVTKEILESHPVAVLKKEISKTNIKGYSKDKKADIIKKMLKDENIDKFDHIEMAEKKERKKPVKKEPVKKSKFASIKKLDEKKEPVKKEKKVDKVIKTDAQKEAKAKAKAARLEKITKLKKEKK
tara:strand:- start:631 stop:1008 length:378 start_codon:yes stop_codon:yes gene_type:complete